MRRRGKHMLISTLDWALVKAEEPAFHFISFYAPSISLRRGTTHSQISRFTMSLCHRVEPPLLIRLRVAVNRIGQSRSGRRRPPTPAKQEAFSEGLLFGFLSLCDDELRAAGLHASTSGERT